MQAKKIFQGFIQQVKRIQQIQRVLIDSESQYNLKKYKITEICAQNSFSIYEHIVDKFYKNHDIGDSATWVENQLRLFIWVTLCYLTLNKKTVNEMKQIDWQFFSQIFFIKERNLFEYQARTLLDEEAKIARWTQQQDYMLYQLIMRDKNAKWNQVAKSLYINSGKRFLRPSKQCRQRWLNHLDPNKVKNGWTINELLTIFEHVQQKGKKWALLVKKLEQKRGEHTIKNKYNSIIKKQGKISLKKQETDVRKEVIERLNKILQNESLDNNDEFILGLNSKSKNHTLFGHAPQYDPRFGSSLSNNDALKKKFDDFRKKIQKFSSQNRQITHHKTNATYSPAPQINHQPSNKVSSLISKLKAPPIFQFIQPKKIQSQPINEQEIFYDDSYEGMLPMQYQNQIMLAEQINNFINQSSLDI